MKCLKFFFQIFTPQCVDEPQLWFDLFTFILQINYNYNYMHFSLSVCMLQCTNLAVDRTSAELFLTIHLHRILRWQFYMYYIILFVVVRPSSEPKYPRYTFNTIIIIQHDSEWTSKTTCSFVWHTSLRKTCFGLRVTLNVVQQPLRLLDRRHTIALCVLYIKRPTCLHHSTSQRIYLIGCISNSAGLSTTSFTNGTGAHTHENTDGRTESICNYFHKVSNSSVRWLRTAMHLI